MTTLQRGEEALLCRVKAVDWARLKICFAATALCMLLAHGFAWFNLFPSHDATILFFDADVVMLQLGRWVQLPYYRFLRGKINMPWLTGAVGVAFGVPDQQFAAVAQKIHGRCGGAVWHSHQRYAAECYL